MNILNCQKDLFSLPYEEAYINCAYQGPMLKTVEEAGVKELLKRRFPIDIQKDDFFAPAQEVKELFSTLIGNSDPARVALIPSASYGLAVAAANIDMSTRKNIVVAAEQFPSNFYCWDRLAKENDGQVVTVGATDENNRGKSWNEAILAAIDENTAVIAMANVHWADGTKFDLVAIGEKARACGAKLVIDGTQSVGALPFNVEDVKPDALVCAGYKWLLGPYGIGLAYYSDTFDTGRPIEENWINRKDSDQFENLVNYEDQYQEKAGRYNAGEHSNFIYLAMMAKAISQLNDWTPESIQEYCRALTAPAIKELEALGCSVEDQAYRASHLFGVRLPEGSDTIQVKEALGRMKVYVSIRGNAVRIAPHMYNDKSHFDMLVSALKEVLA
ncbi:MAG: selenocysteine lyase/cysteine desulfurase [Litorivivens sp.]|jgi:selenocysteine lyase/cysteine desulfurase